MKKVEEISYALIHITSEENFKLIEKDGYLKGSVHDPENGKIQWLGDGIYFWDVNDNLAVKLGKNLVKGKKECKTKKCVGIEVVVPISEEKYMNLENDKWFNHYISFIKKTNPQIYEKLKKYIEIIQNAQNVSMKDLNKIGKITGLTINLFLKVLKEKYQIDVDIVSCYFLHGKDNKLFFSRKNKYISQFCIKNDCLVNKDSENWLIKHNI